MKNIIDIILKEKFTRYTLDTQIEIKNNGRCTPNLLRLLQVNKNQSSRSFNTDWYKKVEWLTGSDLKNKLYCWNLELLIVFV